MDAPGDRKGGFGCVALAFLVVGLCLFGAAFLPGIEAALQSLQVPRQVLKNWGGVFALLGLAGLVGLVGVAYVERKRGKQ